MAARRPLVLVGGQIRQMTVDEFNDLRWQMLPLGMKFPIDTHTTGVPVPPTDNPNYRYIKLTASDSYNSGVLTSESVSGSGPEVQATAVISDAGSPMNGQTVQLINTERRVIRGGNSGEVEADALQGHGHLYEYRNGVRGTQTASGSTDIVSVDTPTGTFKSNRVGSVISDSTYGTARVDNETRVKSLGADYFMRIR